MPSQPIYQFRAELNDYKPKIWRRFQVVKTISMARLGYILMTMFEMQASHLFELSVPIGENLYNSMRKRFSDEKLIDIITQEEREQLLRFTVKNEMTESFDDGDSQDAVNAKLSGQIYNVGDVLMFTYDFGDNWEVKLVLEDIIVDKDLPGSELPRVLAGEGYGIIEDCGGVGGLQDIAKAYKKKKGPQYREYCDWLGIDDLDMAAFDIADMNFRLKKIPRIYTDIYEKGDAPTERSMNLLTRKYKN